VHCNDCIYQAIANNGDGEDGMANPGAPTECSELQGDWLHVQHLKRKPWVFGVPAVGY
jgi:hypothetical protein